MRKLTFILTALVITVSSLGIARAQDADNGRSLAEEWCSKCHDIEPDGEFKQFPPSFAAIAVYRAEDYIISRISFAPVHTGMPQLGGFLSRDEISDVVAYIVSLEKR